MSEQQVVDILKANKHRPLWDMTSVEVEVLKKYREYVEIRRESHPYEFLKDRFICRSDKIYRFPPNFEIPKPEKLWREFDIVVKTRLYVVEGIDLFGRTGAERSIGLDKLSAMVDFGGVKFEGQSGDHWRMEVRMFINQFDWLTRSTLDESPAIPVKARFWMEQ